MKYINKIIYQKYNKINKINIKAILIDKWKI